MSPILIKTIQFFLSLSLLIVLHELGHFIPAKLFKTRVEKFYLFFDIKFSLFKKKIGETVYGIGWLPLGGYVKIAGMIDESMDTAQMAEEPKPWEFRSKPAWQRLIIMLGGVTVNFILAVIIYIGMAYSYGDQYIPMDSLRDGIWVTEKNIGDELGVQTGDQIVAIDGEEVENFDSLLGEIINGNTITINRDGNTIEKEIPVDFIATLLEDEDKIRFISPRLPFIVGEIPKESANKDSGLQVKDQIIGIGGQSITYFDEAKSVIERYTSQEVDLRVRRDGREEQIPVVISDSATIGIRMGALSFDKMEEMGFLRLETRKYTFAESIPAGIDKGVTTLVSYMKQLKKIFNPETGAYKGVGGFAAIGGMF
ncbi:MAG: site-2 protease family protein, partial [Eudoraea sp.]|nr:site-2 protease family protein [Eudoraea sp.]